jgi:shikimate kinase
MSARHVVLVGMMGAGKTSVGRALAERLGRRFLDSDAMIEGRTGRSVAQIFADDGEPAFRDLESEVLREALGASEPAVVAAAGGSVLDPDNRARIAAAGTVVWLHAAPEVLAERVRGAPHRPLLDDDPEGTLARLGREREEHYRSLADLELDVGDAPVPVLVDRIESVVAAAQEAS